MWRTDSLKKTLMQGKTESRRRRDDRAWDSWMTLPTRWTWVWAGSGSWWWTGMLQSMGLQTVGHDWVTELNWERRNRKGRTKVIFWLYHYEVASYSLNICLKHILKGLILSQALSHHLLWSPWRGNITSHPIHHRWVEDRCEMQKVPFSLPQF